MNRKIIVDIGNADEIHCNFCRRRMRSLSKNFPICKEFECELEYDGDIAGSYIRCQACLDAEKK